MISLALAIWRVTSLLYDESGPWDIFYKLREKLGIQHDEEGSPVIYPEHLQPMQCFWCLTLFVALPLVFFTHHRKCGIIEMVLAGSAGAILIEKWLGRSKSRLF
jgi:hypothetical protein